MLWFIICLVLTLIGHSTSQALPTSHLCLSRTSEATKNGSWLAARQLGGEVMITVIAWGTPPATFWAAKLEKSRKTSETSETSETRQLQGERSEPWKLLQKLQNWKERNGWCHQQWLATIGSSSSSSSFLLLAALHWDESCGRLSLSYRVTPSAGEGRPSFSFSFFWICAWHVGVRGFALKSKVVGLGE